VSFTYSGDPAGTPSDAVRLLAGDTVQASALLQDEEIEYFLALHPNPTLAAAAACEAIASRLARKVDTRVGDVSTRGSQAAAAYRERAESLRAMAASQGLASISVGGISLSGKEGAAGGDSTAPAFTRGMDDPGGQP
jgi:hypothetical protein